MDSDSKSTLKRQKFILQRMFTSLAKKGSKNFFDYFLLEFATQTNLFCLFIGVINFPCKTIRTLSFVQNYILCENFEYEFLNHPCAQVVKTGQAYFCEDFPSIYPQAFHFIDLHYSYYLGIPIFTPTEELIGIIVFLSNNKQQLEDIEKLFPHFSARIGVEIQEYVKKNFYEKIQKDLENSNLELRELLNQKSEVLENTSKLLANARQHLTQQDKMATLGMLSAGIAHEINNPLNYIVSSLEGIHLILVENLEIFEKLKTKLREYPDINEYWEEEIQPKLLEAKQDFEVLDENIKIGIRKIVSLLKALKVYSHPSEEVFEKANLHELIQNAINILQYEIKNKVELNLKFDPQINEITCIPNKLVQVFVNLIQNAIQSRREPERGKICISTSLVENEKNFLVARILISDDGKGISKENLEKIFQPFFTTKPAGQGVGLGLFITYGIIEKHKGKITVESEQQKGTLFTIELPID